MSLSPSHSGTHHTTILKTSNETNSKTKLTEHNIKQKSKKNKRSLGKTRDDDCSSYVRKQNGPLNQQGDPMAMTSAEKASAT
ncbi:hypothetical protein EPI10_027446 [Gossypium australe]|uniref:Uncharacterized protein n=1 Tax=Gossypium australe TaxID=47621 RepID=A0A5B6UTN2_9ROSI|nr:hypothetical protein EPI10_027446 [Gossypium australe]